MAINFTDFSKIPAQGNAAANIFEDVLKGFKMEREPAKMEQESKQREFANALQEKALKHKDKEYSLSDQLKQAQINKANQPAALKGALAQAMALRKSLDPNSPDYERDLGEVTNYINKLGTSRNGINVTTNPEGGVEVSIGGKDATAIAGLPPLPKGQTYLFDENKKPIGIGKPYTEAEKKETSGRAAFNIYQKFITDAQAPYSGKNSSRQFEKDIQAYSTDDAAKERIDNLLAADKLMFSSTVKEEATLGGANTNQAYNRISHSLENSEIYPLLKRIAKYQLPQGYAKASSDIFSKKLNEGTEAGQKIPAYKPYYFNQQNQSQPNTQALSNSLNANKPKEFKTGFKSESEFNKYYRSLSPEDRKAYRKHIAEKK